MMDEEKEQETASAEAESKTNLSDPTQSLNLGDAEASGDAVAESKEVKAVAETKTNGGGVWEWIKSASNSQFVRRVVQTTKTGVDKMIVTLDPGMTPYLKEGGEIDITVTSDKEVKWGAIRDAFQTVFGAATVRGVPAQPNIAPQPVGYLAGLKGAQERIKKLRATDDTYASKVCVSVENFVHEQFPEQWFDIGCLLLDDPINKIEIKVFTVAVPVESDIIQDMHDSTPSNYDLKWSGLSVTVGEAIQKKISWINPSDWHRILAGTSRRDLINSAATTLAELYRRKLPTRVIGEDI